MDDKPTPRRASLSDFTARTVDYEIESPSGEVLLITMRLLTRAEALAIEDELPPRPQPPVVDFRKDENDQVQPVYGWQDANYLKAMAERNELLMIRNVFKLWVMPDWDDKTDTEKAAVLDEMPSWAQIGLFTAARMALGIAGGTVRPFRPD